MIEKSITCKQLLSKNIKNKENLIENILPQGTTILAGAAKTGKTYLGLQIAAALTQPNSTFLGEKCNLTKVLYFSNETNEIEIQKRIKALNVKSKNLSFNFTVNPTLQDIEDEIIKLKTKSKDKMIVIIDTLQKVDFGSHRYDNNSYHDSYKILDEFCAIAKRRNVNFILIHHTRKAKDSDDIINNINGSIGYAGAAENIILLEKNLDQNYKISTRSRYLKDNSINIKRLDNGFFDLVLTENLLTTEDQDIIKLIKWLNKQEEKSVEESATDICTEADLKNTTPNVLYKKLEKNEELLKQCSIKFSKRRSNGKNLISLTFWEEEEKEKPENEIGEPNFVGMTENEEEEIEL